MENCVNEKLSGEFKLSNRSTWIRFGAATGFNRPEKSNDDVDEGRNEPIRDRSGSAATARYSVFDSDFFQGNQSRADIELAKLSITMNSSFSRLNSNSNGRFSNVFFVSDISNVRVRFGSDFNDDMSNRWCLYCLKYKGLY